MSKRSPNSPETSASRPGWELLKNLLARFRGRLLLAVIASFVSGASSVVLIGLINRTLTSLADGARNDLLWLAGQFLLVCLLAVGMRVMAGMMFARLSQGTLARLREHLAIRIQRAPFRRIEEMGAARAQSVMTDDAQQVAQFLVALPNLLINGAILIGCLCYLGWLSLPAFGLAVLALAIGAGGFHVGHRKALARLRAAGREQDRLFSGFGSLFLGAKELKLNRLRAQSFMRDELSERIEGVREQRVRGLGVYILAGGWASLMIYLFISTMCVLAASGTLFNLSEAAGYTLIFMYMLLPMDAFLNNISALNMAWVGLERIGQVLEQTRETEAAAKPQTLVYEALQLEGVCHHYYREAEDGVFTLGPVDLTFTPGELTFVIGGNGSGKTSLAKLIVGLYPPQEGRIVLNGKALAPAQWENYRQLFSAVFSDFHLFESLHRLEENSDSERLDREAERWIDRLQLGHKVRVRGGRFSTQHLSTGQRKRLALVVAYLEDRPFYLFDEWAADQDPEFKKVFYCELLPELKARGKTVVVISHDDRYFDVADRCLKLENGQLSELAVDQSLTA